MVRIGADAINYARSRVGPNAMPASGYCLQFVRQCFDVGSYYSSAIAAWNGADDKHPGDRNPPPAVPLYFSTPSQYDHVVFGGETGEIITTFNADVRRYTASSGSAVISQIERDFDGSYLGWAGTINRVDIYNEGEDDMPSAQEVAAAVWGYALNEPTGPVASAARYLVDARVSVGDPNAPITRVSDQVWAAQLARPNGPAVDAGTYLVDTRASVAPVTAGPVLVSDQVWSEIPADVAAVSLDATHGERLSTLAMVVVLAVVAGVAVALLGEDTADGVLVGIAAIIGGLLEAFLHDRPYGLRGRRRDRA